MLSDEERNKLVYEKIIKMKEKEMNKTVKELDFETVAILRDEIIVLKIGWKKSFKIKLFYVIIKFYGEKRKIKIDEIIVKELGLII